MTGVTLGTHHYRALTLLVAAALALGLLAMVEPKLAEAAFPGKNGQIAVYYANSGKVSTGDTRGIYLLSPTGTPVKLASETLVGQQAGIDLNYSSDGRKIIYAANDSEGDREIFEISVGGPTAGEITQITDDKNFFKVTAFDPAYSRDGTKIAYRCNNGHKICVRPSTPGGGSLPFPPVGDEQVTMLTPKGELGSAPAWSPDDSTIAYTCSNDAQPTSVCTIPATGGNPTYLTIGSNPDWSPDGSTLVYEKYEGDLEIYTIPSLPSNGTTPTRLTNNSWHDRDPAYSPDGAKIAYVSHERKCSLFRCRTLPDWEIFTVPATGGQRAQVTHDNYNEENPSWGVATEFTPPVMTKDLSHNLVADRILNQGGVYYVPVRLEWEAKDEAGDEGWASGIARYELQQSIDGAASSSVALQDSRATSVTVKLVPGHTYQFSVRAEDWSGNQSEWTVGPIFRVEAFQENDTERIDYEPGGSWTREPLDGAYFGRVQLTKGSEAKARFSFVASHIAWVATMNSNRGQAEVWIDGVKEKTVDLFSPFKQTRKIVFSKSWDPDGFHEVEIKGLATSGRPAVDVDAFVVLSTESPDPGR